MIRILFLSANPRDGSYLEVIKEFKRKVDGVIRQTNFASEFELPQQSHEVSASELQDLLQRHKPTILHFSGHGSKDGRLVFQDPETNEMQKADIGAIGKLFEIINKEGNIKCVILSACYSNEQAQVIAQHVDFVIGMSISITPAAANAFCEGFYRAIGNGSDLQRAFDLGCNQIELAGLDESHIVEPVSRTGANPSEVVLIRDSAIARLSNEVTNYGFELLTPDYFRDRKSTERDFEDWKNGFPFKLEAVNDKQEFRRTDLLERLIQELEDKRVLVLKGEAGISKSTILMELICDYLEKGYLVLNCTATIKEENKDRLVHIAAEILKHNRLLLAVDNAFDHRRATAYYLADSLISQAPNNFRCIVTARTPDLQVFIQDKLSLVKDDGIRDAVRIIASSNRYSHTMNYFNEQEVKGFLEKYSNLQGSELDIKAKEIFKETSGNPVIVRSFALGPGALEKDVEDKLMPYLGDSTDEIRSKKLQTLILCSLLTITEQKISDELLKKCGYYKQALELEGNLLRRESSSGYWQSIHAAWWLILLRFLFKDELIPRIMEQRKEALMETMERLFSLRNDEITFSTIDLVYALEQISWVPLSITDSAIHVPEYLSVEKKHNLHSTLDIAYLRLTSETKNSVEKVSLYRKRCQRLNGAIESLINSAPSNSKTHFIKSMQETKIRALLMYAKALQHMNRIDEANRVFDEAVDSDPNNAGTLADKAGYLWDIGRREEAVKFYERALSTASNPWVYLGIVGSAYEILEDFDRAAYCYQEEVKINPMEGPTWHRMGLALEKVANFDAALKCYGKATQVMPDFYLSWFNLARLFVRKGNLNMALEALSRAARLEDISFDAKWERDFDSIRNDSRFIELLEKHAR